MDLHLRHIQFALDFRNRREDIVAEFVGLIDGILSGDLAITSLVVTALMTAQIALTIYSIITD